MSVTGSYLHAKYGHGYFFAFHLLNIVNNNQLLSGVIKAVTLNGNWFVFFAFNRKRQSFV